MIEKKEVEKLAHLARIRLSKKELSEVPSQLKSILEYIQKLSDIGTDSVEPLFHFPELKNVVREDESRTVDRETQKKMMEMGKDKNDYLKVESIL